MSRAFLQPGLPFGDYARDVREADVDFLVTDRSRNDWSVRRCVVGKSVLQFGCAGAGTIAEGLISQPEAMVFVLQSSPAPHRVYLNGKRIAWHVIAVLPPGSDFIFAMKFRTNGYQFLSHATCYHSKRSIVLTSRSISVRRLF